MLLSFHLDHAYTVAVTPGQRPVRKQIHGSYVSLPGTRFSQLCPVPCSPEYPAHVWTEKCQRSARGPCPRLVDDGEICFISG